MHSIKGDIKKMRREMCRESLRGFAYEASPRFLHDGCEHAATHHDSQHILMPSFTVRKMEEEDMPKKETLSDYLQEYESQSKRFKDHLKFQGFCKIKEERSTRCKQHDVGIFFLSTFDGSPKYLARAWVEELDTYLRQHQVSENEAIKVAVLHF